MAKAKKSKEMRITNSWLLFLFGLGLAGLAGWNISPFNRRNFETLCQNYNYNQCMKFYWQHTGYFQGLVYLGLGLVVVCILFWAKNRLKKGR